MARAADLGRDLVKTPSNLHEFHCQTKLDRDHLVAKPRSHQFQCEEGPDWAVE